MRLHLRDGRVLEREQHDYEGFHTRPMDWDAVLAKFDRLAAANVDPDVARRIQDAVAILDECDTVDDLTRADAPLAVPHTRATPKGTA